MIDDANPYNKPDSCRLCPLFKEPGPVFGSGSSAPGMMLVGQAPGAEEVTQQKPFVGGSGRVLNLLLFKAEVRRSEVFCTNVVKCRPPNDRPPTEEEMMRCAPFLISEIRERNPNIIVPLGAHALRVLTGKESIFLNRGIPVEGFEKRKVLPTLHPMFVMRTPSQFVLPIMDLRRAYRESATPEIRRIPTEYETNPEPAAVEELIIREAKQAGFVTFDFETTSAVEGHPKGGLDPRYSVLICCGFGSRVGHARCLIWNETTKRILSRLAADPTLEIVGQNSDNFDIPQAEHVGIEFRARSFDTLQAFHLVNSDLPKNLATLNTFYGDFPNWKGSAKEDLFLYNCKDIDATTRAYLGIKRDLRRYGMESLYYDRVAPVQPILRRMTKRGLKKNILRAAELSLGFQRLASRLEATLREGLGRPTLNIDSPKELMDLLYGEMKLPVQFRKNQNKELRPSVDKDSLNKLAETTDNPILKLIIDIRKCRKMDSTFLSVETDEEDFVHPRFGSVFANEEDGEGRGPATGRFASRDPNAQNIPQQLREIYVPDSPEHVIISCDWSQIEWRIAMVLSGDPVGLELLTSGVDNHTAVASEGFGIPYSEVSSDLRHAAKFIVYGLGYGRGVKDLAKQLKQPLPWVEAFIRRFFTRFAVYSTYREGLIKQVERDNYLATAFGRRRWWYSRQVTEAYNFPMQGNAADMMYGAIIGVENALPRDASLRLTVHDELVVVAAKDVAREAYHTMREIMQQPVPEIVAASLRPEVVKRFYPQGWFCPADAHIGLNWAEAKKGNKALEKEILG